MNWGSWLDEYDREARLVPALLALLPLVLAAVGLGVERNPIFVTIIAALFAVGLPVLVAKQVAYRGRRVEAELFAKWGAPPTTLKLIPPAGDRIGEVLRQRRTRLEQATGIRLPAATSVTDDELETYAAAIGWLIEHTRDRARFPVIWKELKSYGFERNMLGVRRIALLLSVIGALALAGGAVAAFLGSDLRIDINAALSAACVLIALGWAYLPSETRVRAGADRYAEKLLDALVLVS